MIVAAALHRIGFALLIIGAVIFLVAFSTPHWFKGKIWLNESGWYAQVFFGLWKLCATSETTAQTLCDNDLIAVSGIARPQALESLGLVFTLLAIGLSASLFFVQTKIISRSVIAATFLAGFCGLIGAIVFFINVDSSFYWDLSLDVNITADVLLLVSAIFHAIAYLKATSGYMNIP